MEAPRLERKRVGILGADVEGYSRGLRDARPETGLRPPHVN
jgi:hypothetical protein